MANDIGVEFHFSRGRVFGRDWDPDERVIPHEHVWPIPCYTLYHTAVVYADGSMAPCRGSFYREDDMGRIAADGGSGAATFREVWNGERFRLARRLFAHYEASPEEQQHICYGCPARIDYHHFIGGLVLERAIAPRQGPHPVVLVESSWADSRLAAAVDQLRDWAQERAHVHVLMAIVSLGGGAHGILIGRDRVHDNRHGVVFLVYQGFQREHIGEEAKATRAVRRRVKLDRLEYGHALQVSARCGQARHDGLGHRILG